MEMFNENTVIRPVNGRCAVELDMLDLYTDLVESNNVEAPRHVLLYKGMVTDSADPSIIGKYVTMSEFSGLHLAFKDKLVKLIPISDILTMSDSKELKIENLKPVANKVLVEIIKETKNDLTITAEDPRKANMQYAKVLAIGEGCKSCKVGDIIGIDPYEGEVIFSTPNEYRVLLDLSIKLIIEN